MKQNTRKYISDCTQLITACLLQHKEGYKTAYKGMAYHVTMTYLRPDLFQINFR